MATATEPRAGQWDSDTRDVSVFRALPSSRHLAESRPQVLTTAGPYCTKPLKGPDRASVRTDRFQRVDLGTPQQVLDALLEFNPQLGAYIQLGL